MDSKIRYTKRDHVARQDLPLEQSKLHTTYNPPKMIKANILIGTQQAHK